MNYLILPLLLISLFMAWRYSKIEIDPDWSLFNMANFTGSIYGRDFVDVKTPAIHVWFWLIGKLVGKSVPKVLFVHHFILGIMGIPYYLMTGNFWAAMAYTVLINSGWILCFHGNVGQQPAVLILYALIIPDPWIACMLFVLAVLFEPKMLLSFAAVIVFKEWYLQAAVISAGLIIILLMFRYIRKEWFDWIWESSVSLPRQLQVARQDGKVLHKWMPWFTAQGVLYIVPWLGASVIAKPDWQFWLPALLYFLFICYGRVIRPNHLIPLIPWIVLGMTTSSITYSTTLIVILLITDLAASGFYMGDIWYRFYMGLHAPNIEAKEMGEWLKDKPGTLWVNGYHTAIHIWAQKPVMYSMTEQAEINTITDRRDAMVRKWKANPPDWVVDMPQRGIPFNGVGYKALAQSGSGTRLLQKVQR